MKKILFCAAAVAMLGLASCSSKDKSAADTASVDSDSVLVEQTTEVTEDTNANGDTLVQVAQQTTVAEVAPADSAK